MTNTTASIIPPTDPDDARAASGGFHVASPRVPARASYQSSYRFSGTDWLSAENAYRLAKRIEAYWQERGKKITVDIESFRAPNTTSGASGWWRIKSDMIGGRPR